MTRKWNPRYVQYAKAHGSTPARQLTADTAAWPGGKMAGFMVWMSEAWSEFRQQHGYRRDDEKDGSDERQREFDTWLGTRDG
jgi:hypothetical protein